MPSVHASFFTEKHEVQLKSEFIPTICVDNNNNLCMFLLDIPITAHDRPRPILLVQRNNNMCR
jgi:hypothetical protein